ncbi:hypothetical protein IMG5_057260 [Ichthyophthirius multifiliis]|uniref:Uncharacterized protein n=1 Tax=Ichthyophthirius multifiliis TaxID=5932 RepID=G0QNC8_ICHMU|nr:hypothetical protein IMG5_057260 [Ichthyophthirius multifiliis]EGR33261.1 hypothetical protein IMG5_057260 [Ichthyophthirius multifiliis]|eukprot:XP_004037247.1 hypothetical protein IMG5_057260 [Ichthyophthirius multifiliis]
MIIIQCIIKVVIKINFKQKKTKKIIKMEKEIQQQLIHLNQFQIKQIILLLNMIKQIISFFFLESTVFCKCVRKFRKEELLKRKKAFKKVLQNQVKIEKEMNSQEKDTLKNMQK